MDERGLEHPDITYCDKYGYPPHLDHLPEAEKEQCRYCGGLFDEEDVYKGYCSSCAADEFNVQKGLKYLELYSLEEDFFLNIAWQVDSRFCRDIIASALKKEFIIALDDERYPGHQKGCTDKLREYCLDRMNRMNDWTHWVDFLLDPEEELQKEECRKKKSNGATRQIA